MGLGPPAIKAARSPNRAQISDSNTYRTLRTIEELFSDTPYPMHKHPSIVSPSSLSHSTLLIYPFRRHNPFLLPNTLPFLNPPSPSPTLSPSPTPFPTPFSIFWSSRDCVQWPLLKKIYLHILTVCPWTPIFIQFVVYDDCVLPVCDPTIISVQLRSGFIALCYCLWHWSVGEDAAQARIHIPPCCNRQIQEACVCVGILYEAHQREFGDIPLNGWKVWGSFLYSALKRSIRNEVALSLSYTISCLCLIRFPEAERVRPSNTRLRVHYFPRSYFMV